jgi:hypothetical protein
LSPRRPLDECGQVATGQSDHLRPDPFHLCQAQAVDLLRADVERGRGADPVAVIGLAIPVLEAGKAVARHRAELLLQKIRIGPDRRVERVGHQRLAFRRKVRGRLRACGKADQRTREGVRFGRDREGGAGLFNRAADDERRVAIATRLARRQRLADPGQSIRDRAQPREILACIAGG